MMEQNENLLLQKNKNLSRKDFLSLTGKSIVCLSAASVIPTIFNEDNAGLKAQTKKEPTNPGPTISPPAKVPKDPETPIELEAWTSQVDSQSEPLPTPLNPNKRVGYAIVGLGHLSLEEIIPAIVSCKKSKLVALVSGNKDKLYKVAGQYGISKENCYTYDTYDELKNNKDVDVIYIVLPNGLHREYVVRGAQLGKHILCEKPMANTSDECLDMIAACKKAKVKLMVAYRIHHQPHNKKLKEIVQSNEMGKPKFIESINAQSTGNVDHWRHKKALAGGGALPDIGLYCLNTARFVLDMDPTEVFAYQYSTPGNLLFKEIEEVVSWQMAFPDGITANCVTHYNTHERRRYEVLCEKGWVDIENAYAYTGQSMTRGYAKNTITYRENVIVPDKNQFLEEMDHFSDCIINDKTPCTPGEEGYKDHVIMEAIYESAATGKPVKIKFKG